MIVLSLDISLNKIGWFLFEHGEPLSCGRIAAPTHIEPERRMEYNAGSVLLIQAMFEPNVIVIEDFSFGSRGRAMLTLAENLGWIEGRIRHTTMHKPIIKISPKTVKKFATGNGNAKKKDMAEAFEKEKLSSSLIRDASVISTKGQVLSDDVVDAYWLGKYWLHKNETEM